MTPQHWFYTPGDSLHSLSDLALFYHSSVGANAHLEIDFAVDRTGNMAPEHAALYSAFGGWIDACYRKQPLGRGFLAPGEASTTLAIAWGEVDRVVLQEDQTGGQYVISYTVEAAVGGVWQPFSSGVTVGSKRIDVPKGGAVAGATALRLTVTEAFAPGHAGVQIEALSGEGCATE